ncbi:MAG: hypothetical protein U0326_29240 [Polyangiales bacterium]
MHRDERDEPRDDHGPRRHRRRRPQRDDAQPRGAGVRQREEGGDDERATQRGDARATRRGERSDAPRVDGATGGEERVGLVERVGDEVEEREVPRAEPALDEHEAHLRAGRPGEGDLDAHARSHDERRDHGGHRADHDEEELRGGRAGHERREADHEEAAEVHHARVEQGGHGRGRLHHLREPPVKGELRGLERRGHDEERRGDVHRRRERGVRGGPPIEDVEVEGARHRREDGERRPEAHVGEPAGDELLVRGHEGLGAIPEEGQELVEREAGGRPREGDEGEVPGGDERAHGREGGEERAAEARLSR